MLNTELGWSVGDDIRVLITAGLPLGKYQVDQIRLDMNYMGENFPEAVSPVIDLLDAYDTAQQQLATLNETSESRVLTKVDVVEWKVSQPGTSYSPERELDRIRTLLTQYFGFSQLFPQSTSTPLTQLIRS